MKRGAWLVALLLPGAIVPGGCGALTPCVDEKLEQWCFHDEEVPQEVRDAGCDTPEYDADIVEPCGKYEVSTPGPIGFVVVSQVFLDGEHVATQYASDSNEYCGGFDYWYGRKVSCESGG